jgi:hypothetical protein
MAPRIWIRKKSIVSKLETSHLRMEEYLAFISSKYPSWVELIITNYNENSIAYCIDKEHLYSIPLGAKFHHLKTLLQNSYTGWNKISFTNKKFHHRALDLIEAGMLIRSSMDTTSPYTYVESISLDADEAKVLHCIQEGEPIDLDTKYCDKHKMTILLENLDRVEFDAIAWVSKKSS